MPGQHFDMERRPRATLKPETSTEALATARASCLSTLGVDGRAVRDRVAVVPALRPRLAAPAATLRREPRPRALRPGRRARGAPRGLRALVLGRRPGDRLEGPERARLR